MQKLSPRKRALIKALEELGGSGTTRQIATKAGLNTNGVSQTLGMLAIRDNLVTFESGGSAAKDTWKLKTDSGI